jgi:hypothetical protein
MTRSALTIALFSSISISDSTITLYVSSTDDDRQLGSREAPRLKRYPTLSGNHINFTSSTLTGAP